MGNFNRDRDSGGRRDFGRRGFGGRGDRPEMHKAICAKCGNECEVPFRPSGDKPVYCSKCFEEVGGSEPRRFGGRDSGRSSFGNKPMYDAVCDNCGNKCQVPFQPSGGKPVFCSQCFEDKNKGAGGGNSGQNRDQFEALNAKLDKILNILAPSAPAKETPQEKVEEVKKSAKPKKEAVKSEKNEKKKTVKKAASVKKE